MTVTAKSFKQLKIWQKARKFVADVYSCTEGFSDTDHHDLVYLLRQSSVSITANIAEGYFRQGYEESIQFYHLVIKPLTETLSHIYIAEELSVIGKEDVLRLEEEGFEIYKMLKGMIKTS